MPDTPHLPPKKRCTLYVDGFNWYFGICRQRSAWKWLNIQSFFEALRLDEDVVAIKFFTALIDPLQHVSTRRDRHKRYLKALSSLPKVKVILGKFQERTVTCQARECQRRLEYVSRRKRKRT